MRQQAAVMLRDIALDAFEGTAEADGVAAVDALVERQGARRDRPGGDTRDRGAQGLVAAGGPPHPGLGRQARRFRSGPHGRPGMAARARRAGRAPGGGAEQRLQGHGGRGGGPRRRIGPTWSRSRRARRTRAPSSARERSSARPTNGRPRRRSSKPRRAAAAPRRFGRPKRPSAPLERAAGRVGAGAAADRRCRRGCGVERPGRGSAAEPATSMSQADAGCAERAPTARRAAAELARTSVKPSGGIRRELERQAARERGARSGRPRRPAPGSEALGRLQQLLGRVEPLLARTDLTLKAGDRALRDVRAALGTMPPAAAGRSRTRRRGDAPAEGGAGGARPEGPGAARGRRVAALGECRHPGAAAARRWKRSRAVDDPEAIAREVRELQQQWREAADVPRAQADALWRRFKTAHDEVWATLRSALCRAGRGAGREPRQEDRALRAGRGARRVDELDSDRRGDQEAAGRVEDDRPGVARPGEGDLGSLPHRVRSLLHPAPRGSRRSARPVWAENLAKKEALCAQAEALADSTDWDHGRRRDQAPAGRVEDDRSGQEEPVGGDLAALPRRLRSVLQRATRSGTTSARAERVAAREAICAELEALALPVGRRRPKRRAATARPTCSSTRSRVAVAAAGSRRLAARGVDPDRARALDQRVSPRRSPRVIAPLAGRLRRHRSRSGREPQADGSARRPRRRRSPRRSRAGRGAADQALSPTDAPRGDAEGSARREHDRRQGRRGQPLARRASRTCVRRRRAWSRIGLVPDAHAPPAGRSLPARVPAHRVRGPGRVRQLGLADRRRPGRSQADRRPGGPSKSDDE